MSTPSVLTTERAVRSRSTERSSSRSRSSRRRHSRRHRRVRRGHKISERNFAAAACSIAAIVGACTALAKSECFTFHGGDCRNGYGEYIPSLGISDFIFGGSFYNQTVFTYSAFGNSHYLINCLDVLTVAIMRTILVLCALSILCSIMAFILDLIGPKQKHLMVMRRNGILNIIAVFLLVTICGLCYWTALLLFDNLHMHKRAKGSKVDVTFGLSYYILVGSAVFNIAATAFNLLRRYPPRESTNEQSQPILTESDFWIPEDPVVSHSMVVREPPPYIP